MAQCIFCKIVAGEIPAAILVETDETISFLDINPVNKGHALIVPKRHAGTLLELGEQEVQACASLAQRVANAVMAATGAEGFNLLQNNARCAGQLVPHVHFHVIPRWGDDGFAFGWRQLSYDEGEMEQMRLRITGEL